MSKLYTDNNDFEYGLNPTLTHQMDYIEEEDIVTPPQEGSTFGNAVARGTDSLQASLFGFTKAVGDFLEIDVLSKLGQDGIDRNIKEILANPPEVKDWDDVDSLADFGTYFLEAIGEQVPQLLVDAPLAIAAFGSGGTSLGGIAARRAGLAAIGKAAKRKLGERAFINFKKASPALLTGNLYAQGAGETQLEFMAEGIDDPGAALLTGIPKAILDRYGMEKILGASKHLGVRPESALQGATQLLKAAGIGFGAEGLTEATQTTIDKMAIKAELGEDYDLFSENNLKEIREAAIKGAIVGGTLSSTAEALHLYSEYSNSKKERIQRDLDTLQLFAPPAAIETEASTGKEPEEEESKSFVQDKMDLGALAYYQLPEGATLEKDAPIPEPQSQIDAQARALMDPASAKQAMQITHGSPFPSPGILSDETFAIEAENGPVFTNDESIARLIAETGGPQAVLGEVLYGNPNGKIDTDGTTVIARDADGEVIHEELSSPQQLATSIANAQAVAPHGKTEITDAVSALNERVKKVTDEFMTPVVLQAIEDKAGSVPEQVSALKKDVEEIIHRLDSDQRVALRQALTSPNSNTVAQQLVELAPTEFKEQPTQSEQQSVLTDIATPETNPEYADREGERAVQEGIGTLDAEDKRTAQREETVQAAALKPGVAVPAEQADKFESRSTRITVPGRVPGRKNNSFTSEKKARAHAKRLNRSLKTQGLPQRYDVERHASGDVKYELKRSSPKARPKPEYRLQLEDPRQVDPNKDEFQFFDDAIAKSRNQGEALKKHPIGRKATFSAVNVETGDTADFHIMDLTTAGMDTQNLLGTDIEGNEALILDGFHSALARLGEMGWVAWGDNPLHNANGEIRRDAIIYHKSNFKNDTDRESRLPYWQAKAKARHGGNTRTKINPEFEDKLIEQEGQVEEVQEESVDTDVDKENVPLPEGKPVFRKQKTKQADNVFGYGIEESEVELAGVIVNDLGLQPEFHVINGSPENLEKAFQHNLLTAMDRWKIQEGFKDGKKGVFIPQGRKGVIVLKPSKQPRHWTMAHEFGHAAKLSAWTELSDANRQRLERMYRGSINDDERYQQPGGFDEWFSDQVANYVGDKVRTRSWADRFFKGIADKLKNVFDKVSAFAAGTGNKRLVAQPEFAEIIEQLKSEKVFQTNPYLRGDERYYYNEMFNPHRPKLNNTQKVKNFFQHGWGDKAIRPFITGDEELRLMGPIGKKIADLFYWPANTEKTFVRPGYFSQLHSNRSIWFAELKRVEKRYSEEELKTAFDELVREEPNSKAAKDIRKFLDKFYAGFIKKTMPLVGYERNYMPRYYETAKIELNAYKFEEILHKHGVKAPHKVTKKIIDGEGIAELPRFTDATGPSARLQHERQFKDPELVAALVDEGFLNSNPVETLDAYINNAVQRGTYENLISGYRFPRGYSVKAGITKENTKIVQEYVDLHKLSTIENAIKKGFVRIDDSGPHENYQIYDPNMLINKYIQEGLKEQNLTPEQAKRAHIIINGYMGKLGLEMPANLNHAQSIAMMATNWMTLSLSAVSSIVEIANIIKAGQDLQGFRMFISALADYAKDKDALVAAYEDMAIVERKSQMDFLSQMYGYNNASAIAKQGNDLLFRINGQQWFTNFTRLVSARMGEQFLSHHAKNVKMKGPGFEDSKRYLKYLGMTSEDVIAWEGLGSPKYSTDVLSAENEEVVDLTNRATSALHRFVDSAVMRPNRAERPVWGNDLRFGMLMHLKTFAYALTEHLIKAPIREAKHRGLQGGALYLAGAWGLFFAFAALGNEIREEIQYRLGGQYRPSNNMDWDKYLVHLVENRIGASARIDPWMELLTNSHHATLSLFSFAPVASKIDQILQNDEPEEMIMDATPFLAQNPGAQWSIKRFLKE